MVPGVRRAADPPPLPLFISEDPIGFTAGMNFYGYLANDPVNTHNLTPAEIRRIRELTFEHQVAVVERWNEHFGR